MTSQTTQLRVGSVAQGSLLRQPEFQPLYNPARIMSPSAVQAAALLDAAHAELARAQSEARHIRDQAAADADRIRETAREDAARAAEEAGAKVTAEVLARAEKFFGRFSTEAENLAQDFAMHAQRSATRIASAIVRAEFAVRPEAIVDLVASALREATLYEKITICVHPDEHPLVERYAEQLRAICSVASSFVIRADAGVGRHGVRIDTEVGSFDGSLDARLARILGLASPGRGASGPVSRTSEDPR
ncbi:MAG: hypothetical protein AMXMBFR58_30170 [Phycisphaerae bacterium]|nr:hypothetical protein [Phycisphaerales bacterium]MCK6476016.1 hypothetical protein [Phycisphaerales bacterium]